MFGLDRIWFFYYGWFSVPFPVGISFPFTLANTIYSHVTALFLTLWHSCIFKHLQLNVTGLNRRLTSYFYSHITVSSPQIFQTVFVTIHHFSLSYIRKIFFILIACLLKFMLICPKILKFPFMFFMFINSTFLQRIYWIMITLLWRTVFWKFSVFNMLIL